MPLSQDRKAYSLLLTEGGGVTHNNKQIHLTPKIITFNKIQDVLQQLKEAGFDSPSATPDQRDILLVMGGKVTDVDEFLHYSFPLAS
jgi:hypothetical protein